MQRGNPWNGDWVLVLAIVVAAGWLHQHRATTPAEPLGELRGAGFDASRGTLYVWGEALWAWDVRGSASRPRRLSGGPFAPGGCALPNGELLLQRGLGLGRLILRRAGGEEEVLDTEAGLGDCMAVRLFGRRGLLLIHRNAQIRFYERDETSRRWSVRDIYSIYTDSQQAGLAMADVDGDGRTDLLAGNYWVRSPERFELPWRIFAINLFFDRPESASMRLGLLDDAGGLVAAQAAMDNGRLTVFRKDPEDASRLWRATELARLRYPRALLVDDLDDDGGRDVLVGFGAGELAVFWNLGEDRFQREDQPAGRQGSWLGCWRLGNGETLLLGAAGQPETRRFQRSVGALPRR